MQHNAGSDPDSLIQERAGRSGQFPDLVPGGQVTESEMATGWAGDGAVQDQIDATVKDGIERAKSRLPQGPGLMQCAECGADIPEPRRLAIPGVRLCLACQEALDKENAAFAGYNRRGSKDSQLR